MPFLETLPQDTLVFHDAPQLIWVRVRDAVKLLWAENPKRHDLGLIAESIERHGFQEIPKYDGTLEAIKAGNGRIEALGFMETQGRSLPRGLAQEKESQAWVMPLIVGTDAKSIELAKAYAVDSNNLTMAGGDFTVLDMARMWERQTYKDLVLTLARGDTLPVSIDREDVELFALPDWSEDYSPEIEPEDAPPDGRVLDLLKVTRDPPRHEVGPGNVWVLGGRHVLICADVFTGWGQWIKYLKGKDVHETVFLPYPGPYAALASRAERSVFVMVQPDPLTAGYVLDAYEDVNGEGSVARVPS